MGIGSSLDMNAGSGSEVDAGSGSGMDSKFSLRMEITSNSLAISGNHNCLSLDNNFFSRSE